MNARPASVLFAAIASAALLVSCSLVLGIEDRSTGPIDSSAPNADSRGSGDGGATEDGTSPLKPEDAAATADTGTLHQLPIGTNCSGRVPPWRECLDFQNGEIGNLVTGGGGSGAVIVSGSDKVLQTTAPSTGGVAHRPLNVGDKATRVVWSFDVRIDAKLAEGTEFGSFDMPITADDFCTIRITRRDANIELDDHCHIASVDTAPVITDLALPPLADGWFNLFVDANLAERKVSASLRWPDESTKQGSGTIRGKAVVTTKSRIDFGIAYATKASVLEIDNIVVWWSN